MSDERLGWILVHSEDEYGEGREFKSPIDELKSYYEPGAPWHWRHHPLPRPGGPVTILFAWRGVVFGEGKAVVTHVIDTEKYSFAFKLDDYAERKPVRLELLPLGSRAYQHRDLIKLDEKVLAAYEKLK
jgi:hypothetical protein